MSVKVSVVLLTLVPSICLCLRADDLGFCEFFMGRYLVREVERSDISLCLAEIEAKRPEAKKKLDQMIREGDLSRLKYRSRIPGFEEEVVPPASINIVEKWDLRKALFPEQIYADYDFVYKLGGPPCSAVLDWSDIEDPSPAWKEHRRTCASEIQRVHAVAWKALKKLEPEVEAGNLPTRDHLIDAFEAEASAAKDRSVTSGEPAEANPLQGDWSYPKIVLASLLGLGALAGAFLLGRKLGPATQLRP